MDSRRPPRSELLHATTVSIGGRGVLIAGASGSGKSDLALRLIDRGAALVADDQTLVRAVDGTLYARAPDTISGRMEVRGLGILALEPVAEAPVMLFVDLTKNVERLPAPRSRMVAGVELPELRLDPIPASAPIKVELALAYPGMVVA